MPKVRLHTRVIYSLPTHQIRNINAKRKQLDITGNTVRTGDHVTAFVVRVWEDNDITSANIKFIVDGDDPMYWATSVQYFEGAREDLPIGKFTV